MAARGCQQCPAYCKGGQAQDCNCVTMKEFLDHWIVEDKNAARTHLDMSGGCGKNKNKFNIPPGEWTRKFREVYAFELQRNHKLFLIEHRTKVFPHFYDIDEKNNKLDWRSVNRREYVRTIQADARRFFPTVTDDTDVRELFRVVVTTAPPVAKSDHVKLGIHIHFPNLWVSATEAKLMRVSAVVALEKRFQAADAFMGESWDDVLDACVYNANGLRMLGADKADTCSHCKGKRQANGKPCTECSFNGRQAQHRPYTINEVLEGDGQLNVDVTKRFLVVGAEKSVESGSSVVQRMRHQRTDGSCLTQQDWFDALELTTVACPEGAQVDPRFVVYEGCPPVAQQEVKEKLTDGTTRVRYVYPSESGEKRRLQNGEQLVITERTHQVLTGLFRRMNSEQYSNLMIQDATYLRVDSGRNKWILLIHVRGEGCGWCHNVCRKHESNRIYFIVDDMHITQRCFSSKSRPGKLPCTEFKSKRITLTKHESDQLFLFQGKGDGSSVLPFNEPSRATTKPAKSGDQPVTNGTTVAQPPNANRQPKQSKRNYECARTQQLYTMLSRISESKKQAEIKKRKAEETDSKAVPEVVSTQRKKRKKDNKVK